MCGNPFKIHEKVDGSYEVEKVTTNFQNIDSNLLTWRAEEEMGIEILSLDEILDQVININQYQVETHKPAVKDDYVPFIRVNYESGMWGVIFEVGNYPSLGKQWIVHGVTKGYA